TSKPLRLRTVPTRRSSDLIFQALLALRQALGRGANSFLQPAERQPTTQSQPFLFPAGETVDMGDFVHAVPLGASQIAVGASGTRSEEHTSELQSPSDPVCR